jgi:hypothetical protein
MISRVSSAVGNGMRARWETRSDPPQEMIETRPLAVVFQRAVAAFFVRNKERC